MLTFVVMRYKTIFLFLTSFIVACASSFKVQAQNIIDDNKKNYYSQVLGYVVTEVFNDKVFDLIADWINTPYKYAGKNERGIDCSGFINVIYKTVFNLQPGINSYDMYERTHHIKKSNLMPGDLVFFKTRGKRVSHVGIYLGENKFAHASVSSGVVISDLDDNYYAKRFAKGGRVEGIN